MRPVDRDQERRRRGVRIGVVALISAVLVGAVTAGLLRVSRARCFALTGPVVCRVETAKPMVALTFDDGPTAQGVGRILPVLEEHSARATFFLIGKSVQEEPELARRIVRAGHELGNHSFSHVRMVGRPPSFYAGELAATQRELRAVGSSTPFFRPPYGKKLFGLPPAVRRAGLTTVMWDVEDPKTADANEFANQVVRSARPGSIILLHTMYPANQVARDALPGILAGLKARGFRVVSVGDLMRAAEHPERQIR
jgi:peptidoglycan/xylan/chitin deacetylase (PgdA/CDA1 family)